MSEPTHDQVERLLWGVYDRCYSWAQDNCERTVSTTDNFNRLFMAVADLAQALAGGYRNGGQRQ